MNTSQDLMRSAFHNRKCESHSFYKGICLMQKAWKTGMRVLPLPEECQEAHQRQHVKPSKLCCVNQSSIFLFRKWALATNSLLFWATIVGIRMVAMKVYGVFHNPVLLGTFPLSGDYSDFTLSWLKMIETFSSNIFHIDISKVTFKHYMNSSCQCRAGTLNPCGR